MGLAGMVSLHIRTVSVALECLCNVIAWFLSSTALSSSSFPQRQHSTYSYNNQHTSSHGSSSLSCGGVNGVASYRYAVFNVQCDVKEHK